MQETKENSLFAELTPEESASVNGGCYSYSERGDNYRRRRRWVVYRRNCDGSFRRVVRYGYW
ncbi:MAG: hypothetical protein JGK17_00490 [Microcoleus sp. PH2017_10_PVI_O_A]|uniref:hypothetical protein n=1 Tax=unclassified Microcoleus TaxID=2642155 RepID=UPI001DFA79A8|nr:MULTISPECIES: hypothetical protein [unclassified Microcoleus]TAE85910.1 MAG: hypothetical protein EAZ83_00765 [Oscillatoriales cyanobacterium]MCC3404097.1 hypothetical protein [Microcoleus sp. PH2017_10_PVI_O_A]MCC3458180.1 hypothetical protein [Microcoleus sp. PH2017_11_PCY_U_A]MCC3476602.1 hypothetical protein [Microcoleus sp. PH2017_12_PCY_D_A]MCC3527879.1 hypothetical protein [Microcoleus sp. PH2017_21_RUC_O_A]